ncbi:MAG: peptidylprolyl isomerase [Acidobacteriota bacterium]
MRPHRIFSRLLPLCTLALLAVGCVGSTTAPGDRASAPTPATPAPAADASGGDSGAIASLSFENFAEIETSMGSMLFELHAEQAPRTVANFQRLVRDGFYDGQPFYRVVAGHVIQAGDGGENDQPTVPPEFGGQHVTGTLGLARDEAPDSGSTEIYVCLEPRPHLDGRYAAFGRLVSGFDVLAAIGAVPVTEKFLENDIAFHEPVEPVLIRTIRLLTDAPES